MIVAAIQFSIQWNQPELNLEKAEHLAVRAVEAGAKLLCLPEVFTTGLVNLSPAEARRAGQSGREFLLRFAEKHGCYIAGSLPFFETGPSFESGPSSNSGDEKPFNTLTVCGPQGVLGHYHKRHLISFLGEHKLYRAGDAPLIVAIEGVRVHFSICYDLRFPPVYWEAMDQADCFVVVANWPRERQLHWESLLRARAIENQAFFCGVNRVGTGGGLVFQGGSQLISPEGEILFHGGEEEGVFLASVDLDAVQAWRQNFPVLKDRKL